VAASRVAGAYARALFDLARERGQVEALTADLDRVAAAVAESAELRDFLARPWVTTAAKRGAAAELAGRLEVAPLVRDFVALVAGQGRAGVLPEIVQAYRDLVDAAAHRVRARVRTAVALTDEERQMLSARLGRALDGKQVVLEEVVDGTLLGGFVAEIGSFVLDGSLEAQLARLHERLARA
jgi:F-type H+-transporting ATPase subunit delta